MNWTTLRSLIIKALKENGENWDDIESTTLSDKELDEVFDCHSDESSGKRFTAWTAKYVYFSANHICSSSIFDGAYWVASVTRTPDGQPAMPLILPDEYWSAPMHFVIRRQEGNVIHVDFLHEIEPLTYHTKVTEDPALVTCKDCLDLLGR